MASRLHQGLQGRQRPGRHCHSRREQAKGCRGIQQWVFFGSGIKTFREECKKEKYKLEQRCSTHPHNTYFQLLSETGIFSFLIILFIFFFLVYENLKIIFKRNLNSLDHSILISNVSVMIPIFPMVPSGNFYNNWISCLIFLSLTINIYIRKNLN